MQRLQQTQREVNFMPCDDALFDVAVYGSGGQYETALMSAAWLVATFDSEGMGVTNEGDLIDLTSYTELAALS
jgi:hypothetical protein